MNLNKSRDFFNPEKVKKKCHIIGCGSIGSNVAELLVRQGVEDITLWDMDVVEPHNIVNQLFDETHIGQPKTEALASILYNINPKLKRTIQLKGEYTKEILSGYVFMCVDSVEVRQNIVNNNYYNNSIDVMFDFRTTLLQGQSYAAKWNSTREKKSLLESLNFTHEEAKENTPVSACGFNLSVAPVVKMTAIQGVINFTNYINNEPLKHLMICEPYSFNLEAM